MKQFFSIAMVMACCLAAPQWLQAQAPASDDSTQKQNPPNAPKPGSTPPASNPFPEDTSKVPVMPTATPPGAPLPPVDSGDPGNVALPGEDVDPVRSPDDPTPASGSDAASGFSDSTSGLDQLLKPPPDTGKRDKNSKEEAAPKEGPKEDENVGSYYLETKNWRAALSRFESALVLDPENPEVYWGLAEAQRNLGEFGNAKANYLKLMEYDPDSKHAKEAKKILKEPEMENAKAVSANAAPAQTQQ